MLRVIVSVLLAAFWLILMGYPFALTIELARKRAEWLQIVGAVVFYLGPAVAVLWVGIFIFRDLLQ